MLEELEGASLKERGLPGPRALPQCGPCQGTQMATMWRMTPPQAAWAQALGQAWGCSVMGGDSQQRWGGGGHDLGAGQGGSGESHGENHLDVWRKPQTTMWQGKINCRGLSWWSSG